MRKPARPNPERQRVSKPISIPSPTGGLNTRDSISQMPPTDAVILNNWIPDTDTCTLRKGYKTHVSGLNGAVETLAEWSGPQGSSKLFAACASSNSVFDVSATASAVSAIAGGTLTNSRWQHIIFGTGGSNYLVMCNGADPVQNFDGSSWTTPTITGTGLTSSDKFIQVTENKERLFFVESSSTSVWFLGVQSISGKASEIDYSSLLSMGGYIQAAATWTLDGGNGIDDYFVILSSEGEAIVYSGTNPANAATWALQGVFKLGAPVGRRCFFNIGADIIVITDDGAIPLSKALLTGRTAQYEAISDKIRSTVRTLTGTNRNKFGWQPILYPRRGLGIINVPEGEGTSFTSRQLVINTFNGSWCIFVSVDAAVWSLYKQDLFFGNKDGAVMCFDSTTSDNGSDILGDGQPAFSTFGIPSNKQFHHARVHLQTQGLVVPAIEILVDYETKVPTNVPNFDPNGAVWDVAAWDGEFWSGEEPDQIQRDWFAVAGNGYVGTIRMRITTGQKEVKWNQTDYIIEQIGMI
jgi:hypothetical protein